MQFKKLLRDIELYIHLVGTENRHLLKQFVNDSALDFLRMDEWKKLQKVDVITLDDSGVYDLTTLLSHPFGGELALIQPNVDYYKVDYKTYLSAADKTYYWSVIGTDLHVTGTAADINFVYLTIGTPEILAKDADENLVTKFYPDIIKGMAVVRAYDFIGDEKAMMDEQRRVDGLISRLNRHENRISHKGKLGNINR